MKTKKVGGEQPIVFSCGGKSQLAQIANDIAITLQKHHLASAGCLAAIANKLAEQTNEAKKSPSVIALDACQYQCVKTCLSNENIHIDHYFDLSEINEKKGTKNKTALTSTVKRKQTDSQPCSQNNTKEHSQPLLEDQSNTITLVNAMRIMQMVYKELNLTDL